MIVPFQITIGFLHPRTISPFSNLTLIGLYTNIVTGINTNSNQMEKFLIIFLSCLALGSCDKSQLNDDLIVFDFQLLDESGKQSTKFSFEENFTFSFTIKNLTDENLALIGISNMDNFFEVFKIEDSHELISFGKPYDHVWCYYISGYGIDSGETLRIEIPWKPDQDTPYNIFCNLKYGNTHLPVGNYQTSVSPTCRFQKGEEDSQTISSSFNISFQITP